MNGKFVPYINSSNIAYMREERKGYFTFKTQTKDSSGVQIMNQSAKLILDMCDGKTDLKKIYISWGKQFGSTSINKVKNDVDEILKYFTKLDLISWKNENPFQTSLPGSTYKIGNYHAVCYTEIYLSKLINFLSYFNFPCERKQLDDRNGFLLVPYVVSPIIFNKLKLRQLTFEYNVSFVMLLDENNEIQMVIGINGFIRNPNIEFKTICEIILIAGKNKTDIILLSELLDFMKRNIANLLPCKFSKLRLLLASDEVNDQHEILNEIKKANYCLEAKLLKEINDKDLNLYVNYI